MPCSETNTHGEPCKSRIVLPNGRCPAHQAGADMRELGRSGGKRSGEARRDRGKNLAELVSEVIAQDVDPFVQRLRVAMKAGDRDTAIRLVEEAMSYDPFEAERAAQLEQARERRNTGAKTEGRYSWV